MENLIIIAGNYAWLAAWLAACMVLGIACWGVFAKREITPTELWANPELALFFTISTGLALHILVLIVLAVSNLLSPVPIISVLTGLTVGSMISLRLRPAGWNGFTGTFRLSGAEYLRILPILLLILPWVIRPLGPPSGPDALTYHLPYARFYLEQGGLVVNETLRFPLQTHNINLLYSAALIRPGATLTQLLHAAMGFLAMLGVFGMARRWHGWLTAVLVVLGVLLFAEFVRSFGYAYVGNGVVLFGTAAFLTMALWIEERARYLLWFCALFSGIAMGIKYHGALFTVPLGLTLLWFSKDLKLTIRFALLTSIIGLFWYLRSWWISGNPVHPFAGELFGYYIWTADDLAANMKELQGHGVDKNLLNFLLLPERLFSERLSFNGSTGNGGILIGVFMLSCLLFRWQRPAVKAMQLTCLAYLLFWFWSSQVIRYLLLITPLMSLCAVTAFASFFSRAKLMQEKRGFTLEKITLPLTIAMLSGFGWYTIKADLHHVPLNKQQQAEFLGNTQPAYDLMIAAAADPRIGTGPVLQFRLTGSRYFFPGMVYGDWMGAYPYNRYSHWGSSTHWEINDSETLFRQIKAEGFKAVAMNKNPDIQFSPQDIASYREHFEIVLETDGGVLMIPKTAGVNVH